MTAVNVAQWHVASRKNPMNYLIIYAHPSAKSFNHAIREVIEAGLKASNHAFAVRDLYEIGFDPALKAEELESGEAPVDVRQEQDYIRSADVLVFVYPLWWSGMPAILKGYIDRVFSCGFAWSMEQNAFTGLLKGKQAVIVNTMATSRDDLVDMGLLECMTKTIDEGIFDFCGIEVVEHKYLCAVLDASAEERARMLKEVGEMISRVTGRPHPLV